MKHAHALTHIDEMEMQIRVLYDIFTMNIERMEERASWIDVLLNNDF